VLSLGFFLKPRADVSKGMLKRRRRRRRRGRRRRKVQETKKR